MVYNGVEGRPWDRLNRMCTNRPSGQLALEIGRRFVVKIGARDARCYI